MRLWSRLEGQGAVPVTDVPVTQEQGSEFGSSVQLSAGWLKSVTLVLQRWRQPDLWDFLTCQPVNSKFSERLPHLGGE